MATEQQGGSPGRIPTVYAVEMYFDAAGERRVRELSNRLRERDVSSGMPAAARPHVSLAVFDEVDVGRLSETIEEFARESSIVEVRLTSIGTFPTDEGRASWTGLSGAVPSALSDRHPF